MHSSKAFVTLAAVAALGAVGGAAVVGVVGDDDGATTTVLAPAAAQPKAVAAVSRAGDALSASEIYAQSKDSVAFVTSETGAADASADPYGQEQGRSGEATGSGFVVSADGYLVTNAHVVDGASAITVKIGDGDTQPAELVGTDESTDIALLKVTPSGTLKPLDFADSDALAVGDETFAIGNPFGLDRTLTTGVVSALQRQITAPNGFSIDGVIQTDAPINPGNSGGPLLDGSGDVIGVNSQILTGSSSSEGNVGIGFAAPSNTVENVVEQLRQNGRVDHAYLGVQMGDAESGGAQVGAVGDGGPAAAGGVQAGDVITSFDGKPIADSAALSAAVNAKAAGDEVTLTVERDGAEQMLTVTLGEQPASAASASDDGPRAMPGDPRAPHPGDPSAPQQGDPSHPQQGDPSAPQQGDPSHPQQGDPSAPQQQDPGQGQQIDPRELLEQLMP